MLTHQAAAWLTFWPELRLPQVDVAVRHRVARRAGYISTRRIVPPDLVVERQGLRCTAPALTRWTWSIAVVPSRSTCSCAVGWPRWRTSGGRWGSSAGRRGNAYRRQLVLESRDSPWSPAERRAYVLLREAGITGWVGNLRVLVAGHPYYLDFGFPEQKLAVEIDGREFHSGPTEFDRDRWRQNDLVNGRWRVLRFTARMLEEAARGRGDDPRSAGRLRARVTRDPNHGLTPVRVPPLRWARMAEP